MINTCLGFSSHFLVFITLKDWKQVIRMEPAFQKKTNRRYIFPLEYKTRAYKEKQTTCDIYGKTNLNFKNV